MCGIVGFTGKYDRGILKSMNRRITHRGPDESGESWTPARGLAMRRLSIIDVEGGHQPIANEDKTIWTVFNGEIYNFRELRIELKKKGHVFRTDHSDTEVIVHAYEEYGAEFVNHFNGMFAIAVWDDKKQRLCLYRDRMGEKPLYYWKHKNDLFFASEIKSLLAIPFFKKKLNEKALFYYLGLKNSPREACFFDGVETLGPGEYLIHSKGAVKRKVYWEINAEETLKISEEDAAGEIRKLLKSSVKYRMISDVPLGAYLSGGVDSSAVVGLMSRLRKTPIDTFSLTYKDELSNKAADEFWAAEMSAKFKTNHRKYRMAASEYVEDLDSIVGSFDEPFGGTISTFFLSKLIQKHVKVAVSGDGADELFGSYKVHRLAYPLAELGKFKAQGKNLSQLSSRELEKLIPFDQDLDYLKSVYEPQIYKWHAKMQVFSDDEKRRLFSKGLGKRLNGLNMADYYKRAYKRAKSTDPLNQVLQVECQNLLPDHVLAFVDRLSMAHSIEVRPPFLDHRLVEFVFKLPGRYKINAGVNKSILKKSLQGFLPQKLLHRPKEGFILPYYFWMQKYLCDKISRTLSPKELKKHGLFDAHEVENLLADFKGGSLGQTNKILLLYLFQIWWKKYFE